MCCSDGALLHTDCHSSHSFRQGNSDSGYNSVPPRSQHETLPIPLTEPHKSSNPGFPKANQQRLATVQSSSESSRREMAVPHEPHWGTFSGPPQLMTPGWGYPPLFGFGPGSMAIPPHMMPPSPAQFVSTLSPLPEEEPSELNIPTYSRPGSAPTTVLSGQHEWRQYIHPNGSLYWTCPAQRVVSDKAPQPDTIESLPLTLQSLHHLLGYAQWEVYVAENSVHIIHHYSRTMSASNQMIEDFRIQIQETLSDIETSASPLANGHAKPQ
jgi:hypothetical protein